MKKITKKDLLFRLPRDGNAQKIKSRWPLLRKKMSPKQFAIWGRKNGLSDDYIQRIVWRFDNKTWLKCEKDGAWETEIVNRLIQYYE